MEAGAGSVEGLSGNSVSTPRRRPSEGGSEGEGEWAATLHSGIRIPGLVAVHSPVTGNTSFGNKNPGFSGNSFNQARR